MCTLVLQLNSKYTVTNIIQNSAICISFCSFNIVTSITNKLTNKDYGIEKQWGYEPNQFWIVKTRDLIEESSTVLLSIQFSGSLSDGIVGFYKAFYANNTK